jgi:single-strand DNA-binding protein
MNVFTFTGRLTKDAEFRSTPNGMSVLQFSVANNTGFGDKQKTNFVNCSLIGKRAEGGLKDILKKGKEVGISGELNLNTFKKRDGTEGFSLECKVNTVDLLGSSGGERNDSDSGSGTWSKGKGKGRGKKTLSRDWSSIKDADLDEPPF